MNVMNPNTTKCYLLILNACLLLGCVSVLYAGQNADKDRTLQQERLSKFELFRLKNLYIPESGFAETPSGMQGKFSVNMLDAGLNVPTKFQRGNTILVHSLNYELLQFKQSGAVHTGNPASLTETYLGDLAVLSSDLDGFGGGFHQHHIRGLQTAQAFPLAALPGHTEPMVAVGGIENEARGMLHGCSGLRRGGAGRRR